MIGSAIKLIGGVLISYYLGRALVRHLAAAFDPNVDDDNDDHHYGSNTRRQGESPSRSHLYGVADNNTTNKFYRPCNPRSTSSKASSFRSKVAESPTSKSTLRLAPPSSSSTSEGTEDKYFFVQKGKSPVYEIPENVDCLIRQNKVPPVLLRKPLSASTYIEFFAALLYAEDHYHKKWSDYKLFNVDLELKQAAVYDKNRSTDTTRNPKHDKTLASFVIDAVSEKRPLLLSRDFVIACPSNVPSSCTFQGLICHVERTSNIILVEFRQDFFSQHRPTSKYDVSFSFNRVCLKRCHQAIEVASTRSCLRGFIFPDSLSSTRTRMATSVSTHMFNHTLDKQQRVAVDQILSLQGPPSYLIEGELAVKTGTSRTITKQQLSRTGLTVKEAVAQLYRISVDHRILVCAHANRTCDVLVEHLKEDIMDGNMFRANAAFREIDGVPSEILSWSAYKGECFTYPPLQELQRFRVIVSTYMTSFRLHGQGIAKGHFSHIFLVDASDATEPEVMVAVANLVGEQTAVIVSGSKGGSPGYVRSDIARKYGLMTSYFERLKNCSNLYHGSSASSMFISLLDEDSAKGSIQRQVSWTKPRAGWVKLNVDGSKRFDPPSSAIGGVLRDSSGEWIVGFSNYVGQASVLEAELQALRDGLNLTWSLGFRKVEVNSDSQTVVHLLKAAEFHFHPLVTILDDCYSLINRDWDISLHHSLREANQVADALAKEGHGCDPGERLWRSPPMHIAMMVDQDKRGVQFVRR
ncbi:unnamed protein product [Linum tenue]|uniref:RNase H type-1 domain-containing protein n=2 Tax=Linum tenue TaxID=586396 RepID=A0AAV0K1N3_9ROSI|nr:unnamed protein product [Linum tenue]CAI0416396.1 unnamed protein product [Linum tenue]